MTRLAALRITVAAGLGLSLLLAGCGAGQSTQTSQQSPAVNGANGQIGPMAVRNAELVFPDGDDHYYASGSDAPLLLTIANTGNSGDELVSISTPAAESVKLQGQRVVQPQQAVRAVQPQSSEVRLQRGELSVLLENLTTDVRPGITIPVTLLFRQSGQLNLDVPIGAPEKGRVESTH